MTLTNHVPEYIEVQYKHAARSLSQLIPMPRLPGGKKSEPFSKAGTAYVRLYWARLVSMRLVLEETPNRQAATEFEDELVPSQHLLHPLNAAG